MGEPAAFEVREEDRDALHVLPLPSFLLKRLL